MVYSWTVDLSSGRLLTDSHYWALPLKMDIVCGFFFVMVINGVYIYEILKKVWKHIKILYKLVYSFYPERYALFLHFGIHPSRLFSFLFPLEASERLYFLYALERTPWAHVFPAEIQWAPGSTETLVCCGICCVQPVPSGPEYFYLLTDEWVNNWMLCFLNSELHGCVFLCMSAATEMGPAWLSRFEGWTDELWSEWWMNKWASERQEVPGFWLTGPFEGSRPVPPIVCRGFSVLVT